MSEIGFTVFLIGAILAFYCLIALPGVAAFFYVIDNPDFSPRTATGLSALLAALFAPAMIVRGHMPAMVPFVVSPLFDNVREVYWPNAVFAVMCGCIMYVVRRRKNRGRSQKG
jgi:hypothetical protein